MMQPPHSRLALDALPLSVLVVDDHADCADSLALLVRLYGHGVEVVSDGNAALQAVRALAPDVVLLDLGMPGMDGYELAQRLHALDLRKRPLLIAVTGYGTADDRRRSAAAGIDLHLVKPVEPDQLQQVLSRFRQLVYDGVANG